MLFFFIIFNVQLPFFVEIDFIQSKFLQENKGIFVEFLVPDLDLQEL